MRNKIIIGCLLLGALPLKRKTPGYRLWNIRNGSLNTAVRSSKALRSVSLCSMRSRPLRPVSSLRWTSPAVISTVSINMIWISDGHVRRDWIHNTYSLGATVSQPIYAGGQIYNNYKAAQVQGKITEQAEELTTDDSRLFRRFELLDGRRIKEICTM